jgi:hypothetical protein
MAWTVHLAARQPRRAAVTCLVCALVVGAASRVGDLPLLPFAAALALLTTLSDFFFPVTYRLDAEGVASTCLTRRRHMTWPQVRHLYVSSNSVRLSPLPKGHRLEHLRGMIVLLPPEGQEAILEGLRAWRDWYRSGRATVPKPEGQVANA